MKKYLFIFFLFIVTIIFSEEKKDELLSFMVHGEDHIVSIALPQKWNVSMDFAHKVGVNGFFYLRDSEVTNSPAAIILNLAYKKNENSKLEDWADYDTKSFINKYKDFSVKKINWDIKSKSNYKLLIYSIESSKSDIIQYSVFIDAGLKYFANIYLQTSKKLKDYEVYVNDFKNCIINSDLSGIGLKLEKESENKKSYKITEPK